MEDLQQLRREIDQIDRQITDLFRRRMAVTAEVGAYKVAHHMPVLDPQREQEVLAKKAALVEEALRGDVTELFETIMSISRRQQRRLVEEDDPDFAHYIQARSAARSPLETPRVLYQGEPGAWAEEAAVRFFGDNCPRDRAERWEDIFLALKEGRADYGVLPIENSSTGSINQVYDLLARYGAFIVGEQVVRVEHCLCAPPGASLDTLEEVCSHEQGLFQCGAYLDGHPAWRRTTMVNTAVAAHTVARSGDVRRGAICSERAAALYGLTVLARGINTNQENNTRFVVVSPVMELREGREKISALFTLPHRCGTLHRVMSVFAVSGLNMMKLESRPIPGRSWEYRFFVDFAGDLDAPEMDGVLRELTQSCESFRVLGNY